MQLKQNLKKDILDSAVQPFTPSVYEKEVTQIWSSKRQSWIKGPSILNFKNNVYSYYNMSTSCIITLNRTTILILGGQIRSLECYAMGPKNPDICIF